METQKNFHFKQQLPVSQLNEMQGFVQESIDHVVHDGVTDEMKYTGFTATKTSTLEVTLEAGRIFDDGAVYALNAETPHNMVSHTPLATQRIVAIAANVAEVDSEATPLKILINAENGTTQPQSLPTEKYRNAVLNLIPGLESPAPQKPTVPVNLLVICWVWLDNADIIKIEMNADGYLPSVKNNNSRLNVIEDWQQAIGQQVETVGSDVSALANRQGDRDVSAMLYQLAADMAIAKETLELEDDYTFYQADRYLDDGESDVGNPNFNCKLDEGVRFSNEAEDYQALDVFNQHDANIQISNGFLLPDYNEVLRLAVDDVTGENNISQYQFETVDYEQKTVSRTRIRYGDTRTYCTNSAWWRSGRYDSARNVFHRNGETWQVLSGNTNAHSWLRVRRFWYDTYEDTYWDRLVEEHTVNGAMVAQTFLNSQDNWVTSLDLFFTQVAATGDLTVLITETDGGGKPDKSQVIKSVSVPASSLTANAWNNIVFPAMFLDKGKQYGICLITQGNHYVGMTGGQNFSSGTFFYSTDGAFLMGDLTTDMCFRLNVAQFKFPRLEVELEALSLPGGIADIDLMAQMIVPDATNLIFEIQPGDGKWYPLTEVQAGGSAFNGLPPLCQFRAVFLGTKDVMPGIDLQNSTYTISRPRTTAKHISQVITLPAPTQDLKVDLKIEEFYEANHDCVVTIDDITNGVNGIAAGVISDFVLGEGDDANHLNIKRSFEFGATELTVATTQYRINIDMTTTSALDVFHGSERVSLAF